MLGIISYRDLQYYDNYYHNSSDNRWYFMLLGNKNNETPALIRVFSNYTYLNMRTGTVRFFFPGYEDNLNFHEEGFLETLDWLENGCPEYKYSDDLELILLPFSRDSHGKESYDFEHMLHYNLDALMKNGVNIINYIQRAMTIISRNLNFIETSKHMEVLPNGMNADRAVSNSRQKSENSNTSEPVKKIFISYSRKDLEIARHIKADIESRIGDKCWMDLTGLESGAQFEDVIVDAIDKSEIVLFLLSENSMQSSYVKMEIRYAYNVKKKVVPISIDDSELKGWFLFALNGINIIFYSKDEQREKLFADLMEWTKEKESKPLAEVSVQDGIFNAINERFLELCSKDELKDKIANFCNVLNIMCSENNHIKDLKDCISELFCDTCIDNSKKSYYLYNLIMHFECYLYYLYIYNHHKEPELIRINLRELTTLFPNLNNLRSSNDLKLDFFSYSLMSLIKYRNVLAHYGHDFRNEEIDRVKRNVISIYIYATSF